MNICELLIPKNSKEASEDLLYVGGLYSVAENKLYTFSCFWVMSSAFSGSPRI